MNIDRSRLRRLEHAVRTDQIRAATENFQNNQRAVGDIVRRGKEL
jgi:hypothetical protein